MNLIQHFSAINFKAMGAKPMALEFAPVTLLFGPNSAGKSTLIQALHYAYEVLVRHNVDADRTERGGNSIELGGFKNLIHRRDLKNDIHLEFRLNVEAIDLPEYRVDVRASPTSIDQIGPALFMGIKSVDVSLQLEWSELQQRPYISRYTVITNGPQVQVSCSADGKDVVLQYSHPLIKDERGTSDNDFLFLNHDSWIKEAYMDTGQRVITLPLEGTFDALPEWGKALRIASHVWQEEPSGGQDEIASITELLSRIVVGPGQLLANELEKMTYIGPLREVPDRDIQPVRSPDPSRWAGGLAAWDLLAGRPDQLVPGVNEWLSSPDRFNTGYSIVVDHYREVALRSPLGVALTSDNLLDADNLRDYFTSLPERSRIRLVDEDKGVTVAPRDLGVGLSQLIPVIVASVVESGGGVLVEQPELHMHPAVQVQLGDLFIQAANKGLGPFLIETHSEHLLLRILRRIRETTDGGVQPGKPTFSKEQVAVYFVESDPDSKGAVVRRLRVTDDGDFSDPWPRGFFEERDAELF